MASNELDTCHGDAFELALLRALMQGVGSYVACIDRQRCMLFINRTLSRDRSEILGRAFESFVLPAERKSVVECVEQVFSTGEVRQLDFTSLLRDLTPRHFSASVLPFRGPRNEELALMIVDDVTEQRRLVDELERSQEFRRRVVEHLPDFVSVLDRDRRFVWVNRLAPGLSKEDVVGKKLDDFHEPNSSAAASAAIQAAFDTATVQHYESEGYGDGTSTAFYLVRAVPIVLDGAVENVLLITSDISERKRAEQALRQTQEQLHRAQRLESLGQLAGGIAHDFNNLLQVIQGNLSFAQGSLKRGVSPGDGLEQALRATERAAELTSQLLAIGRRKRVDSKRTELAGLVANSLRMLRRTIPENVALRYEAPAAPLCVELDGPQFEQVLLNLCVNARDAMPSGGTLIIRIEAEGTTHAVMSVTDTGTGISSENLQHVFEPFFTTKGAGSGLGLAVAAGIVNAHGGSISAESDGASTTTMKVRLPLVAGGPEPAATLVDVPITGSGVFLVAEDEAMVRAQVVRLLEHAGYQVIEAENGAQAVARFREHLSSIDLVLLDVVMPELDGWQTFVQIEKLKPGIKVLFTTGYAANVLPDDFAARGARLLSKPYKAQQLWAAVRELLEQEPPAHDPARNTG